MINQNHSAIVEGLLQRRVDESVNASVLKGVDKFLKEQKANSSVKTKINGILNKIQSLCDKMGENTFSGGTPIHVKGSFNDAGSPDSGPSLEVYPSIHEVVFQIKFLDRNKDFNKLYDELYAKLKKEASKFYKEYEADDFSISISVDFGFNEPYGFYVVIEKHPKWFVVRAGHQTNPSLDESKIQEESNKIEDLPFIQKRKEEPSEEEKEDKKEKSKEEDTEESSTCVFGTEIGLPIDKENCESTGISGVSTPTGVLNDKKKKVVESSLSNEEDLTVECPKCHSQIVNMRDAGIFHCADCGYEWTLREEDKVVDGMLDNEEDEDPKFNDFN